MYLVEMVLDATRHAANSELPELESTIKDLQNAAGLVQSRVAELRQIEDLHDRGTDRLMAAIKAAGGAEAYADGVRNGRRIASRNEYGEPLTATGERIIDGQTDAEFNAELDAIAKGGA